MINDFLLNLPLPLLDNWGYLFLFILTILEALPVIGNFVPGQIAIIFGGFLAYLGVLRLDAIIVVASLGAILGDIINYIIGRRYGHDFLSRYGKYFFINKERLEKVKVLVRDHAGKALIFGRFGSFTRTFSAFSAGVSRVKFSRFIFFALAGGISWAAASALIGYIFGQGFERGSKYFGRFILLSFVVIMLIFLGYNFLNKKKHVFLKQHGTYLFLNALSIYVFFKMAQDYFSKEWAFRLDLWLSENVSSLWQADLNYFMAFITEIFRPEVLFALAAGLAVYFFLKKDWLAGGLAIFSAGGGLAAGAIIKTLVKRPRPLGGLIPETNFSFPSQHALMAMIFFSLVLFFFYKKIKNIYLRYFFALGNLLMIGLIGFSRIYLRVHWFSDVAAGWALGLFWVTLLTLIFAVVRSYRPQ